MKNTNDAISNVYGGSVMKKRYVDVVKDLNKPQEEERTAEEVIEDIGNKLDMIGAS